MSKEWILQEGCLLLQQFIAVKAAGTKVTRLVAVCTVNEHSVSAAVI